MYMYSIEMHHPNKGWITEIRFYNNNNKSNKDFDTIDIPNKRRNFQALFTDVNFDNIRDAFIKNANKIFHKQ